MPLDQWLADEVMLNIREKTRWLKLHSSSRFG